MFVIVIKEEQKGESGEEFNRLDSVYCVYAMMPQQIKLMEKGERIRLG